MNSYRRAFLYSGFAQYTSLALEFVSVIIVSRLLSPAEIGVFSVGLAIMLLGQHLRTFGTNQLIVSTPQLTPDLLGSAVGLSYLMSWSIGLGLWFLAPAVAHFYSEPGLQSVLRVTSFTYLLVPVTAPTIAMCQRALDFRIIYRIRILSSLSRASVTIVLALQGMSFMSMAWGILAGSIVETIVTLCHRQPETPLLPRFRRLRDAASFGFMSSGSGIFEHFSLTLPELMLGKLASMEAVGIFSRALGLAELYRKIVARAIEPVLLPYFSAEMRDGRDLSTLYVTAVERITTVAWPFFGVLYICAEPLTLLLYGDQWTAAVPIAQALCLWGAVRATFVVSNRFLVAAGLIRLRFAKEPVLFAIRFVAVYLLVALGAESVAHGITAIAFVEMAVNYLLVRRATPVGLVALTKALLPCLLIAVAITGLVWVAGRALTDAEGHLSFWILPVAAVIAGPLWVGLVVLTKRSLAEEITAVWARLRRR